MSDPINYLLVIPFIGVLVEFYHCYSDARSAKARKDKAYLAVTLLESALDILREHAAAAPEHEDDQRLAAVICLVKENLSWARLALVLGIYSWAEEIAANTAAEIAKRSLSQVG
jgi:hypothetical protein